MSWKETGVSQAVAQVAPAVRMLLSGGKTVCFEADESLKEADFAQRCSQVKLNGLWCAAGNTEGVYRELKGAKRVCTVGVAGLGVFFTGKSKQEADARRSAWKNGEAFVPQVVCDCGYRRLDGKIAIVTGSAQGFGDGIAREMLAQGAYVVIADLNLELAQKNADELIKQYGQGCTIAVKVDVGDEASVQNLLERTAAEYGGLDIFVSNAGVLKAGSLEEMTQRDFEFVTKINYTAFFLCTKHAARVMRVQYRFWPEYYGDVIQINSKSGLAGSNKNFAYAGGKFGGIGLVQSFAKELVADHIKVNAICPGNYYEGPLWSDPERGLFVQYLNAGKVPGAKDVEDVRRFYIDQVPMRKGCSPLDVARAIFYCVEQTGETGQAIPVTGGQIMLK